jgi:hypothetical protein
LADLLGRAFPAVGHHLHEALINYLDFLVDRTHLVDRERADRIEQSCARAVAKMARGDPEAGKEGLRFEARRDDTDRSGDGGGLGDDGVCRRSYVVATAGGDVGKARDERFVGCEANELVMNPVGGECTPAR